MPRCNVAIAFLLLMLSSMVTVVQAEEPNASGESSTVPVATESTQKTEQENKRPSLFAEKKEGYGVASGSLINTALGLVAVLALIIGMAWLLRRFGGLPSVGKGAVSVVGGVSLGPRERAVLLQVGETQVLVGVAPGQVRALHVLDQPLAVSGEEEAGRFSSQLNAVMRETKG
jgi:flagellar protein FliO/FliZ